MHWLAFSWFWWGYLKGLSDPGLTRVSALWWRLYSRVGSSVEVPLEQLLCLCSCWTHLPTENSWLAWLYPSNGDDRRSRNEQKYESTVKHLLVLGLLKTHWSNRLNRVTLGRCCVPVTTDANKLAPIITV